MRRPDQPTGEVPELNLTRRLNPITHPTEIIRRVETRMAERQRPDRLLDFLLKGAVFLIPVGTFFAVLAALNARLGYLILFMGIIAAGCCMATLETLLDPDRPELDERLLSALRKGFRHD
jgi:hypothetical protein